MWFILWMSWTVVKENHSSTYAKYIWMVYLLLGSPKRFESQLGTWMLSIYLHPHRILRWALWIILVFLLNLQYAIDAIHFGFPLVLDTFLKWNIFFLSIFVYFFQFSNHYSAVDPKKNSKYDESTKFFYDINSFSRVSTYPNNCNTPIANGLSTWNIPCNRSNFCYHIYSSVSACIWIRWMHILVRCMNTIIARKRRATIWLKPTNQISYCNP